MEEWPRMWYDKGQYPGRFRSRPVSVIRRGEWKLIENYETGTYELYNISDDIGERKDLSSEYPQKVQELLKVLNRWKQKVHAPIPDQLNPAY